jgi:hypothetical protein
MVSGPVLYTVHIYQAASLFTQEISEGFRLVLEPKLFTYTRPRKLTVLFMHLYKYLLYLYKIARIYVTNPLVCLLRYEYFKTGIKYLFRVVDFTAFQKQNLL